MDQSTVLATDHEEVKYSNLQKPFATLSPFEVSLTSYNKQPWINHNVDLTQWFNYNFNPATWSTYCLQQLQLAEQTQMK